MRKYLIGAFIFSWLALSAQQGNLERLETDKGFGTTKIGMMLFVEDYQAPDPTAVKSRYNEFSLLKEKAIIGGIQLDNVTVWAHDLIVDRISMLVAKDDKDAFLHYAVEQYGNPEMVLDMYVWKSPEITLSFRANPQKSAINRKGQGLGIFWRTTDFEHILESTMQMQYKSNAK